MEARGILAAADKTAAKVEALRDAELPETAKGAAYYGLLASDKEQEMLDALLAGGAALDGQLADSLLSIKAVDNNDALKGAEKSNAKRNAIAASGLSDQQKEVMYRRYISETRDDDIEAFHDAGLSFNDFLEAQNAYATINDQDLGAGEKATEFSR